MTLSKIDEWIKEVEQRPGSAVTILKLIAGRLRDLTARNEELLAENIALQDGSRVEEFHKRISHLEFQLDLLKRRFGLNEAELAALVAEPAAVSQSLLAYNARGRILRLEPHQENGHLGRLVGELSGGGEPPRLLAAPASEELLLLFTSGRMSTCSVENLPVQGGEAWQLEQASLPDEPHAGERLACLTPLSWLPLADHFLQASRRGCLKKTMTSIAETVFANKFLGKGAVQKQDQPFDLLLCQKGERFLLVTRMGRLLAQEVDELSYSVEEWIKLDGTDHVVAAFICKSGQSLLCLTQTGKVIAKSVDSIGTVKTAGSRGQALIPPGRLEQGVRFIGAAAIDEADRLAVLDEDGELSLYTAADLLSAGSIQADSPLLAFGKLPGPAKGTPAA